MNTEIPTSETRPEIPSSDTHGQRYRSVTPTPEYFSSTNLIVCVTRRLSSGEIQGGGEIHRQCVIHGHDVKGQGRQFSRPGSRRDWLLYVVISTVAFLKFFCTYKVLIIFKYLMELFEF